MKKILAIILATVCTVCLGVAMVYTMADSVGGDALPSVAYIGDEINVPDYFSDGKKAEVTVTAPSGNTYKANKVEISENGVYRIDYSVDGVTVKSSQITVPVRPRDLFDTNKFATISGQESYAYSEEAPVFSGVGIAVSNGAEITFTRTLDMESFSKSDTLVKFIVKPNVSKKRDFGKVILTFTDTEDSEVFFKIMISAGDLDSNTPGTQAYVRAGANGQTMGGYELAGGVKRFNTSDIYGTPCYFSLSGNNFTDNGTLKEYDYVADVRYDSQEKAVYVPSCVSAYKTDWLVSDFDDANVYGATVWSGFKSGKAKLTITFEEFVSAEGKIIFNEIGGIDMSQTDVPDTEPPVISIDLQGHEKAPNSYIGASYPVFSATATDNFDENCKIEAKVYYNENNVSDVWYDVSVENDKFLTNKIGKYKIKYIASDRYENQSEEEIYFYCLPEPQQIVFKNLPSDFSASVYQTVAIENPDNLVVYGGNGNCNFSLTVYAPSGKEVEVNEDTIILKELGEYRAVYTAIDFFGNKQTATVIVTSEETADAVFTSELELPEVMIADFVYELPVIDAVYCENGAVKNCTVKIYADGEELNGNKLTAKQSGAVNVEYRAYKGDGSYRSVSRNVAIVNGNKGKNQSAYFYDKKGVVTATQNRSEITFDFLEDGNVFFANSLGRGSFNGQFSYVKDKLNYTSFKVKFIDGSSSKTLTVTVTFSPSGYTIACGKSLAYPLTFKEEKNIGYFAIVTDFIENKLYDVDNKLVCEIKTYDDGTAFDGFTSVIYADFSFGGVKAPSKLSVSKLNNQILGYKEDADDPTGDKTAPEILINGEYPTRSFLGEEITLFTADCFDVLSQTESLTVSVFAPDNTAVLRNQPADEIRKITFDKVGRYRIVYTATDSLGNKQNGGATILVLDNEAPTLSVSANYKKAYKTGSRIKLPSFTASDNQGYVSVDVLLRLPSSEIRLLLHYENGDVTSYLKRSDTHYPSSFKYSDDEFILETPGKYTLTVTAYDDHYNVVTETFVLYAV